MPDVVDIVVVPKREVFLPLFTRPNPAPLIQVGDRTEAAALWLSAPLLPRPVVVEACHSRADIELLARVCETGLTRWCEIPGGLPLPPVEVRLAGAGLVQLIQVHVTSAGAFLGDLTSGLGTSISQRGPSTFVSGPAGQLLDDIGRTFSLHLDLRTDIQTLDPSRRHDQLLDPSWHRPKTPVPTRRRGLLRRFLTPLGYHGYDPEPPPIPPTTRLVRSSLLDIVFRDPRITSGAQTPTLVTAPSLTDGAAGAAKYFGERSPLPGDFPEFVVSTVDINEARPILQRAREQFAAAVNHPTTRRCMLDRSGLCIAGSASHFTLTDVEDWCALVIQLSDRLAH